MASPTVLVTGASSGIGAAYARALAAEGHPLVLVARRVDRLEALAGELQAAHGVRVEVVPADLSDPDAPERIRATLAERGVEVDWLLNNAGLGVHGPFAEVPLADQTRAIALNVMALTAMTRTFLPGMIAKGHGAVINVASTAAFQAIPFFAVYAATKAYVLSFSEALAEEVVPRGVKVLCVCPGATESEFTSLAEFKTDLPSKIPTMTAEQVARETLQALKAGEIVHVTGLLNWVGTFGARLFPRRLVTRVSGAVFKPTH